VGLAIGYGIEAAGKAKKANDILNFRGRFLKNVTFDNSNK
jgi:hypothetical protein